jgi:hypothetical protein
MNLDDTVEEHLNCYFGLYDLSALYPVAMEVLTSIGIGRTLLRFRLRQEIYYVYHLCDDFAEFAVFELVSLRNDWILS